MTNQRGFSLAELLVACAVLAMVLAGVFTLLQEGQFAYIWGTARVETQQNARWVLDMMTREIRTATSLTTTTSCDTGATSITFVDQNGATIQYLKNGSTLERHVNGSVGASDIMTGGVQTLTFTCYQSDGTATATAGNVRMIVITVTTTPEDTAASQQSMMETARVRLRNVL